MELSSHQIHLLQQGFRRHLFGDNIDSDRNFGADYRLPLYEELEKKIQIFIQNLKEQCFSTCKSNCPDYEKCQKETIFKPQAKQYYASRKQLRNLLYPKSNHKAFQEGFIEICCRFLNIPWPAFTEDIADVPQPAEENVPTPVAKDTRHRLKYLLIFFGLFLLGLISYLSFFSSSEPKVAASDFRILVNKQELDMRYWKEVSDSFAHTPISAVVASFHFTVKKESSNQKYFKFTIGVSSLVEPTIASSTHRMVFRKVKKVRDSLKITCYFDVNTSPDTFQLEITSFEWNNKRGLGNDGKGITIYYPVDSIHLTIIPPSQNPFRWAELRIANANEGETRERFDSKLKLSPFDGSINPDSCIIFKRTKPYIEQGKRYRVIWGWGPQ